MQLNSKTNVQEVLFSTGYLVFSFAFENYKGNDQEEQDCGSCQRQNDDEELCRE